MIMNFEENKIGTTISTLVHEDYLDIPFLKDIRALCVKHVKIRVQQKKGVQHLLDEVKRLSSIINLYNN